MYGNHRYAAEYSQTGACPTPEYLDKVMVRCGVTHPLVHSLRKHKQQAQVQLQAPCLCTLSPAWPDHSNHVSGPAVLRRLLTFLVTLQDATRLSPTQERHLVRAWAAARGDQLRLLDRKRHLTLLLQACPASSCSAGADS